MLSKLVDPKLTRNYAKAAGQCLSQEDRGLGAAWRTAGRNGASRVEGLSHRISYAAEIGCCAHIVPRKQESIPAKRKQKLVFAHFESTVPNQPLAHRPRQLLLPKSEYPVHDPSTFETRWPRRPLPTAVNANRARVCLTSGLGVATSACLLY